MNFNFPQNTDSLVIWPKPFHELRENVIPIDLDPYQEPIVIADPPAEDDAEYEIEKILDKKTVKKKVFYLVKWKGFSHEFNTWEPETNFDNATEEIQKFEKKLESLAKKQPKKKKPPKRSKEDLMKKEYTIPPTSFKNEDLQVPTGTVPSQPYNNSQNAEFPSTNEELSPRSLEPFKKKGKLNSGEIYENDIHQPPHPQTEQYTEPNDHAVELEQSQPESQIFESHNPTKNDSENTQWKLQCLEDGRFRIIQGDNPVNDQNPDSSEPHLEDNPPNPYEVEAKEVQTGEGKEISEDMDISSPDSSVNSDNVEEEVAQPIDPHVGSLAFGDIPLKVLAIRPNHLGDDLEVLISWKPRPDGTTPENSLVMRMDLLKKKLIMPLIEYYENKMKLSNVTGFDFTKEPQPQAEL